VSPSASVLESIDKGNPLAIVYPTDGAILMIAPSAVLAKAPHPNAARLLIAWLISPEAKMLYETLAGQADIRANSNSPLAQEIKAAGAKVIYEDVETMNQRAEYYRKLMSIVRGQG
jgi:iron(III) transport system substrate-binding protein